MTIGRDVNMPTAKLNMSIPDIQRRMAQIRHDMHQEVQGAVEGARTLTDWKSLVRSYPWTSLSIAAAIGYFVVPKRRAEPSKIVAVAAHGPEVSTNMRKENSEGVARVTMGSVLGTAFGLLSPLVIRAAQTYALTYFEQWLANHPLVAPGGNSRDGAGGRPASTPAATIRPASRLQQSR
jgi:hypothetical protein